MTGPFAGMLILNDSSWADGHQTQKLLGVYESELHPSIETIVSSAPKVIVNLGCAEGYYSVGLAMRCPDAHVYAIDTDSKAVSICERNASVNSVRDRVTALNIGYIPDLDYADVVICDVEGAEQHLLNPDTNQLLSNAHILVELHPHVCPDVAEILIERFSTTHEISRFRQGSRDPNQFSFLRPLHEMYRWAAVNEYRPYCMEWLFFVPKIG